MHTYHMQVGMRERQTSVRVCVDKMLAQKLATLGHPEFLSYIHVNIYNSLSYTHKCYFLFLQEQIKDIIIIYMIYIYVYVYYNA
jgi:hypothetical protein